MIFWGGVTLEIYLLQEKVLKIINMIINRVNIRVDKYHIVVNLTVIVITLVGAYLYHQLADQIYRKVKS